jgi:hypothetical protein
MQGQGFGCEWWVGEEVLSWLRQHHPSEPVLLAVNTRRTEHVPALVLKTSRSPAGGLAETGCMPVPYGLF